MNSKDKKNIIITCSIIFLLVLVLITIGVTYAFFQLQINNESTNTNIELTTGEINNILLSGKIENFHLTVNANDMSQSRLGEYYATTDTLKNYADGKSDGITNLGTIEIDGTLTEKQTCTAIANIEIISDINEKIEQGDFELGLIYGEAETLVDLKDNNKATIEFELNEESPSYIRAYLKLNNANRDQSYLADKEISVKVNIESFECSSNNGEKNLELLQEKGGDTFTLKNGMYRFVGDKDQVTNNYICFGTDNTDTCKKTPETYMYRIIGMTNEEDNTINLPSNSLKLIKATPSRERQQWHGSYTSSIMWDLSAVKTYLNGTTENGDSSGFLQTIINGLNGVYWNSLILSHSWYNADQKGIEAVEEPTTSWTDASKIGLMYATDYKNSGEENTNNWLYIINGWSTNSSLDGDALYLPLAPRHYSY